MIQPSEIERFRSSSSLARRASRSRRAPSEAGGDRQADQRCHARDDGDRKPQPARQRAAGEQRRQPQHPVADHAAEADGQRPARAPRQGGGAAGGQHQGGEPEQQAEALALQGPMGGEPPAPDGDRQHERERRHAEQLDQQVGDDGAGHAEHVAHRRIGGMAQRGVLHRPGRQCDRQQCRERKQREAAELAQAPAQRVAHRLGKEGQTVEAAPHYRHAVPHPSTATRRCSACAVVSWSCTIATLM